MKYHQRGYIALMSAIIIALLLLTITLGIGFSSIFGRLNILDSESKERSLALAEACANTAILNVAQNQSQPATVTIGQNQCKIISVTPQSGQTTIKTQACFNKSVTNLNVVIDDSFAIISFQDLPNFSPNISCP